MDEIYDPYDLSNYSKNSVKNTISLEEPANTSNIKKNRRKMTDDEDLPQDIDLTKNVYKEQEKIEYQNSREISSESNFPKYQCSDEEDYEEDIPLLEDLGVNIQNIKQKVISILTLKSIDKKFLDDSDMAGPFFIICFFSFTLMLQKKSCFGYLYGISVFGSILVFLLLNLMGKTRSIMLYNTISILGYCLLPVALFSMLNVFINTANFILGFLCLSVIVYCSISATRFFETLLEMQSQKILIFYPIALFYTCFVLVAIF